MSRLIITRPKLMVWAEKIGATGLPQAEHDYRLVMALKGLSEHPELGRELAFKGGTALNKLYFGESNRLSVDLDFNAVGAPGVVMKRGAALRKLVEGVLREQDPDYQLSYKYSEGQTTIAARYAPLMGPATQPIKVEVSVVESVPILGLVVKTLDGPEGPVEVRTYRLEELLAGKVRALYDRRKGRDIYDLDRARAFSVDERSLRKLVYYYFFASRKIFSWTLFRQNLEAKAADRRFGEDARPFLRPSIPFDARAAVGSCLERFAFLGQPDEADIRFLETAKALVGRTVSEKKRAKALAGAHPIRELMDGIAITEEAAALSVEDLARILRKEAGK